jgi:hypothetical protein
MDLMQLAMRMQGARLDPAEAEADAARIGADFSFDEHPRVHRWLRVRERLLRMPLSLPLA